LPKIRPEVTEFRLHRLTCCRCGTSTRGEFPAGVPTSRQGPRLQSAVALLTGAYRLSKRMARDLCADMLGVPLSPGQICALAAQTAQATDPVVAELREYARARHANVDETGWRQQRRRAWLWVVVTSSVTVFRIALTRAARVARELIDPSARQVVTTDRYKGYDWLPLTQRQLCWAHLRRDFQAMIDRRNAGSEIGEELLFLSDLLFDSWHRVRDETLRRRTFAYRVECWWRPDVRCVLERGRRCGCARTAATCRELLSAEPALWTFARVEGVEPTNNAAERALRHGVQWRKSSYGTDSEAGSRFVANILTIVATCRQQGRDVLEYLTECCRATRQGFAPPSLMPVSDGR
jgi:transposase